MPESDKKEKSKAQKVETKTTENSNIVKPDKELTSLITMSVKPDNDSKSLITGKVKKSVNGNEQKNNENSEGNES